MTNPLLQITSLNTGFMKKINAILKQFLNVVVKSIGLDAINVPHDF